MPLRFFFSLTRDFTSIFTNMPKKRIVKLLTDEEYAKVFDTFTHDTNRHSSITHGTIYPIVNKYAGTSIDLMSVGAGTGWLEDEIIRHPDLRVKSFLAIEPNPQHAKELREKSANWKDTITKIDLALFDEHYVTTEKFDVILMVHSIYYSSNPIEVIIKAASFLKPDGQIIIVVRGDRGSLELSTYLEERVEFLPTNPRKLVGSGLLVGGFKENNINFQSQDFTDYHDVTEFIERTNTSVSNDVISFYLNTKYEGLDKDLQDGIYKIVQENVTVTKEEKHMFFETLSCFIVESI